MMVEVSVDVIEALEENVAGLKDCIRDHEEDCAILPEDRSVTETVTALQERVAELEEQCKEEQVVDAWVEAGKRIEALERGGWTVTIDSSSNLVCATKRNSSQHPSSAWKSESIPSSVGLVVKQLLEVRPEL